MLGLTIPLQVSVASVALARFDRRNQAGDTSDQKQPILHGQKDASLELLSLRVGAKDHIAFP